MGKNRDLNITSQTGPTISGGERFGAWTAIRVDGSRRYGRQLCWFVLCRCDCGTIRSVSYTSLHYGLSRGCYECRGNRFRKPNSRSGYLYCIWKAMIDRCANHRSTGYGRYGGRGITVCERWQSYEQFFEDMGHRPTPGHQIERIDNDGPYAPENCRWATTAEQARNTRQNHLLTYQGKTQTVVDWAAELGMSRETLFARIRYGWSVQRMLTEPVAACLNHSHRKVLVFRGESATVSEWAKRIGIPRKTLDFRLSRGWTIERTLTEPRKTSG